MTAAPAFERIVAGPDGLPLPASSDLPRWGGKFDPPAIGETIRCTVNGLGLAVVTGYFTLEGFLGFICDLTDAPEWHRKQNNGNPRGHLFGTEFEPLTLTPGAPDMTANPHNLPPHLVGMTQARWDSLTPAQRANMVDKSALHPALIGLEGMRVRVTPARHDGLSVFRVGKSTGWRPIHLAMRKGANGASDTISPAEIFHTVTRL